MGVKPKDPPPLRKDMGFRPSENSPKPYLSKEVESCNAPYCKELMYAIGDQHYPYCCFDCKDFTEQLKPEKKAPDKPRDWLADLNWFDRWCIEMVSIWGDHVKKMDDPK